MLAEKGKSFFRNRFFLFLFLVFLNNSVEQHWEAQNLITGLIELINANLFFIYFSICDFMAKNLLITLIVMFLCLGIIFASSVNTIHGEKPVRLCVNGALETHLEKKESSG